jgi:hypothetical protein
MATFLTRRFGVVGIRAFDQGVVTSLGGILFDRNFYVPVLLREDEHMVQISGVDPPPHDPPLPGIPITFANPEDIFERYRLPAILVSRDDMSPAMQRWHPTSLQYRAPSPHSTRVQLTVGGAPISGPDKIVERQQAIPYDLSYTISVQARDRDQPGIRSSVNAIATRVMQLFPPYGVVRVIDSKNEERLYDAFQESTAPLDESRGVADRMLGFAITLRIEGELDLSDEYTRSVVTRLPTVTTSIQSG